MHKYEKLPEEFPLTLYINDIEIGVYQVTKNNLEYWVYGYLSLNNFITNKCEVSMLDICYEQGIVYVDVVKSEAYYNLISKNKNNFSGCSKGGTFFSTINVHNLPKNKLNVEDNLSNLLAKINVVRKKILEAEVTGIHSACLLLPDENHIAFSDISMFSSLAKLAGYCQLQDRKTEGAVLFLTEKVTFSLLVLIAQLNVSYVCSEVIFTKQALQLANFLQISALISVGENKIISLRNN